MQAKSKKNLFSSAVARAKRQWQWHVMQCTARLFLPSLFYFLYYLASTLLRIFFLGSFMHITHTHTCAFIAEKMRDSSYSRDIKMSMSIIYPHIYTQQSEFIYFLYIILFIRLVSSLFPHLLIPTHFFCSVLILFRLSCNSFRIFRLARRQTMKFNALWLSFFFFHSIQSQLLLWLWFSR